MSDHTAIAVTYEYDPERAEQVNQVRPAHREFLKGLLDDGYLIASGPYAGEPAGALLLLDAPSPDAALDALNGDPFWEAGLVIERIARPWSVVVGELRD